MDRRAGDHRPNRSLSLYLCLSSLFARSTNDLAIFSLPPVRSEIFLSFLVRANLLHIIEESACNERDRFDRQEEKERSDGG